MTDADGVPRRRRPAARRGAAHQGARATTPRRKQLFETYGVHFDPTLRDEVVARVDQLKLPSYTGFVMPRLEAGHERRRARSPTSTISYPLDLTDADARVLGGDAPPAARDTNGTRSRKLAEKICSARSALSAVLRRRGARAQTMPAPRASPARRPAGRGSPRADRRAISPSSASGARSGDRADRAHRRPRARPPRAARAHPRHRCRRCGTRCPRSRPRPPTRSAQAAQGWKGDERAAPASRARRASSAALAARLEGRSGAGRPRGDLRDASAACRTRAPAQVDAAERTLARDGRRAPSRSTDRLGVAKGFEALVRHPAQSCARPASDALALLRRLATPAPGEVVDRRARPPPRARSADHRGARSTMRVAGRGRARSGRAGPPAGDARGGAGRRRRERVAPTRPQRADRRRARRLADRAARGAAQPARRATTPTRAPRRARGRRRSRHARRAARARSARRLRRVAGRGRGARAHRHRSVATRRRRAAGIARRTRWSRSPPPRPSAAPPRCRSSPARASGSCGCTRRARRPSSKDRDALEHAGARRRRQRARGGDRRAAQASPATTPTRVYVAALSRGGYQVAARGGARARRVAECRTRRCRRCKAALQRLVAEGRDNSHDARTAIADDADAARRAAPAPTPPKPAAATDLTAEDLRRLAAPRARITIRGVGTFELALFTAEAPATVLRFARSRRVRLLQRPDVPPRRAELRDPGRQPRRQRIHRRRRLHARRGRAVAARARRRRHLDARPRHRRRADLHRSRRQPAARSRLHGLRPGAERHRGRRSDSRRRRHRARRDRSVVLRSTGPSVFSSRVPAEPGAESADGRACAHARRTASRSSISPQSNPTRAGFDYPPDLLAPLGRRARPALRARAARARSTPARPSPPTTRARASA